jgi:hypothetical protein
MSAPGVVSDAPAKDVLTAVQWIGKDFPISKDFSFQRGIKRLCQCIISAGSNRSHGLGHAQLGAAYTKRQRGIHGGFNQSMQHDVLEWLSIYKTMSA